MVLSYVARARSSWSWFTRNGRVVARAAARSNSAITAWNGVASSTTATSRCMNRWASAPGPTSRDEPPMSTNAEAPHSTPASSDGIAPATQARAVDDIPDTTVRFPGKRTVER